jgi:hypothetical protein
MDIIDENICQEMMQEQLLSNTQKEKKRKK